MIDKVFGIKSSILLLVIIYLGFISLGLPDAVLGVAWDYMRIDFSRPVQYAGFISMLLTCCSAVSSFCSGAILKRVSVGRLLAICGFVTGVSLLGYSLSPAFWVVLLLAIPLGFGQGAVDTGMNYYVAANYSSSQMNWLHCCWGIGAGTGPLLTTWLIASGSSWRWGYGVIAAVQITLALMFAFSNRMWQRSAGDKGNLNHKTTVESASYSRGRFYSCVVMMWLYTGIESSIGLWGYMYLTLCAGTAADVAGYTMAGYWGMLTVGRFVIGFFANRLGNIRQIRWGLFGVIAGGVILLFAMPQLSVIGMGMIGFALAPIYPAMMHAAPERFNLAVAGKLIGFQGGAAMLGVACIPPAFGWLAAHTTFMLLPFLVMLAAALMLVLQFMVDGRKGGAYSD